MWKKAKKLMWKTVKTPRAVINRGLLGNRLAMVFVLLFAAAGTYFLLNSFAASKNATTRSVNGSGANNLIIVGSSTVEGNEDAYIKALVNSQTQVAFRTVLPDWQSGEVTSWSTGGRNWYYTVAASDMVTQKYLPDIYVDPTHVPDVLNMAGNKGLYMHEVVSYYAQSQHDADVAAGIRQPGDPFDWPRAVASIDWVKLDSYVTAAKNAGKKVLWNEPDAAWEYMESNAFEGPSLQNPVINTTAQYYLRKWGDTIVPVFATNFPFKDRISVAMIGAHTFASKSGSPYGESVQSFYFSDQKADPNKTAAECTYELTPTAKCSYNLINYGYANKASYFAIDGTPDAQQLSSLYMQGITSFASSLSNGSDPYGIRNTILPMAGGDNTTPANVTSTGTTYTGVGAVASGTVIATITSVSYCSTPNNCASYCYTFVCMNTPTATTASNVNATMTGGWAQPEPLNGQSNYGPAAVSRGLGSIDVLATGKDAATYRKIYSNGTWANWNSYGGATNQGPAVSTWGTGRLDMFVRGTNNAIYQNSYDSTKSTSFTGWQSIGGNATSKPAAVSWGSGRIDVFIRGTDNALWHKWYQNGWYGWESLGGTLTSAPAVTSWGSGHLDVFVRGGDGAIWHKWYTSYGWSNWASLGGSTDAVAPVAVTSGYGHIFAFAVSAGHVYWKSFDAATGWASTWTYIGATTNEAPAVASWSQGRLDLFTTGTDSTVYHSSIQLSLPTYTPPPPPPVDTDSDGAPDTSDPCPTQWGPSTNHYCPVHIIPLYHYYNPTLYDSFYTTAKGNYTYNLNGTQTYWGYADCSIGVMDGQNPGSVPLWRYWNGTGFDHFYTITRNDAGYSYYGYSFEGQEGWVYPPNTSSSLYNLARYWAAGWIVDHFYHLEPYGSSPNWSYPNYNFEGVEAQVFGYNQGC